MSTNPLPAGMEYSTESPKSRHADNICALYWLILGLVVWNIVLTILVVPLSARANGGQLDPMWLSGLYNQQFDHIFDDEIHNQRDLE